MVAGGALSRRACVSINAWEPSTKQWDYLLSLQTPEDRALITSFRFQADAKRSMLARLMLQSFAASSFEMEFGKVKFARTKEGRPFPTNGGEARGLNLNLSHHGAWVFLGAEQRGLVGVDVMTTGRPHGGENVEAFFDDFTEQLTDSEWRQVRGAGPSDVGMYFAFFIFWALKESYIKATGTGLGFGLKRCQFEVEAAALRPSFWRSEPSLHSKCARLVLDGRRRDDWFFELGTVGDRQNSFPSHVIATAVGPFAEATPSLRETLGEMPSAEVGDDKEGSAEAWREVEVLTVEELLSAEVRERYALCAAS